jgi:arabinogalactan oligomer/maltooligosaccharide transport system substrate-binding protein
MKSPIRLAALAAGLAIVAGACGPGGATTGPTGAPATGAPATAAPGTQAPAGLSGKITLWHSYASSGGGAESAEVQALNKLIENIETANPGLDVESIFVTFDQNTIFNNFKNESATGGGPDMFIAPNDDLGNMVRGGYFVDLTGKIDDVLANTSDVAVEGSKVDGKVYMVPESLKAVAMYYDSAKVATPPATTDELEAWIEGGGKAGILTGAYFGWGFYSAFGGSVFNDGGTCAATANSGVADAIAYVKSLNALDSAVVDSDYAKINDPFLAGDLDLIFNGNWALADYRKARPTLAVAPFPSGPAGEGRSLTGTDGWYINAAASAEQQALAIDVAKFFVSAESQQVMVDMAGHVPANKSVTANDPLVKSFTDAVYAGFPRPQTAEFGQYWGPFGTAWSEAIPDDESAGTDPATSVATACTTMDAAIAAQ